MEIVLVLIGIVVGVVIGWLLAKSKAQSGFSSQIQEEQQKYNALDKSFAEYKAGTEPKLQAVKNTVLDCENEIKTLKKELSDKTDEFTATAKNLSTVTANNESLTKDIESKIAELKTQSEILANTVKELNDTNKQLTNISANYESLNTKIKEKEKELVDTKEELKKKNNELNDANKQLATANASNDALTKKITEKEKEYLTTKEELTQATTELNAANKTMATLKANHDALNDKLDSQKKEMEELGKKFNTEFENIASKILDIKTEKFTELNKNNLTAILEPLGKNIDEFKKTVNETYDKESKERFSLGEKVKELALLNQIISDEARNLTKALKGEAKTQGRWGEMILESILEKSGLRKDEEYFMEHQLHDDEGNALKSDSENKKMRPDAVIKYPDNRHVIIDSKVSLNAFTRFLATDDFEVQKTELNDHVTAIKTHILALSARGYDDYDKSLDFVMMFVPSEPAYMAAIQGDPDIWNFAYDKRILLINPTNLIICLKLIVDLWKREYQNKNAQEIAERGAKLYDKFVGFISNLDSVGEYIDKAKGSYSEAYKQLSTGNDNLVLQADKLKRLGLKTKKELNQEKVSKAISNELTE